MEFFSNSEEEEQQTKVRVINQKLQMWYLTVADTACGAVIAKLFYVAAWLSAEITSLLATLTPEPLLFKVAFTYLDLTQNIVMTRQLPESYSWDHSAEYR